MFINRLVMMAVSPGTGGLHSKWGCMCVNWKKMFPQVETRSASGTGTWIACFPLRHGWSCYINRRQGHGLYSKYSVVHCNVQCGVQ